MARKTLTEAAKEILDASRGHEKEPMHHLADTGSGLDSVRDIGGSSWESPVAGAVGSASAAGAPSATPPGVQPDPGNKEPMHVLDKTKSTVNSGTNKVDQAAAMDGHVGHQLAKEETEAEQESARKARWDELKEIMKAVGGIQEDMTALFDGEKLSEEFKNKAATIYEAAVLNRATLIAEKLETEILNSAQEAIDETRKELEEQIDTYLNSMVAEWVQQNEVAIESGLRAEIVESFISSLKNVFAEHYIDVPEEQVDLVGVQAEEIEQLTNKLNEFMNKTATLERQIQEGQKSKILNKVCEGLTATQAEKVKTLAEGVGFTTEGEYEKKVKVLVEGYAKNKASATTNPVVLAEAAATDSSVTNTEVVDPFVESLRRTLK